MSKYDEKTVAPIIFQRITNGFRIEFCQCQHYKPVFHLIKTYYLANDILCKSTKFTEDEDSMKSFLDSVYYILQKKTSLVLLDESNLDEVVGVLLLTIIEKIDFGRVFSKIINNAGAAHEKCNDLDVALNKKIDIYDEFRCETFLRIFLTCIKTEHRGKLMGNYFFRAAFDLAKLLKIPVICGVFSNSKMQRIAARMGFITKHEIFYKDWLDKNENSIFPNVMFGNHSCALMIWELPKEVVISDEPEVKESTGKGKKKKGKDKKKKAKK